MPGCELAAPDALTAASDAGRAASCELPWLAGVAADCRAAARLKRENVAKKAKNKRTQRTRRVQLDVPDFIGLPWDKTSGFDRSVAQPFVLRPRQKGLPDWFSTAFSEARIEVTALLLVESTHHNVNRYQFTNYLTLVIAAILERARAE